MNEKILIANRKDSFAEAALAKNFNVTSDFEEAARVADGALFIPQHGLISISYVVLSVLFLLVPDQVQPRLFNETLAPCLKSGVTIVVASGYNMFFKLLKIPPTSNVVMVAPR